MTAAVAAVADKIAGAGFELFCLLASTKDKVLIKIRAPLFLLRAFADSIDFAMELEPGELHAAAGRGWTEYDGAVRHIQEKHKGDLTHIDAELKEEFIVKPFSINDDAKFSTLNPYTHIYGKYDQAEDLQPLYKRDEGLSHPFHNLARIKLIQLILESKEQTVRMIVKHVLRTANATDTRRPAWRETPEDYTCDCLAGYEIRPEVTTAAGWLGTWGWQTGCQKG